MPVTFRIAEVGRKDVTPKVWDAFAESCGASFKCSYFASIVWQFEDQLVFRVRRFEIYMAENGLKFGQCAVGIGLKYCAFADSLQLIPEFECLWGEVMMALLATIGPGVFRYGSHWNIEPPREKTLRGLDGVRIESIESFVVQAVEFSRWTSWAEYLQQVSQNARRNAARALRKHPMLRIRMRRGLSTFFDLFALTALHLKVGRRKRFNASPTRLLPRLIIRILTMGSHTITAVVNDKASPLAVFGGIEFGANTYYLTGGSEQDNGGAAWHLLLTMIRRAYDRAPANGRFLMGCLHEHSVELVHLARSREQCRVSNMAASIILFEFCRQ